MDSLDKFNLVGSAPSFLKALALVRRFAACDATVLIQGETGTGKELAARAIHYLGARRDYPFIPVNCGAIPDNLVENELFGHARGAFTDAREPRAGVIADAEGGTLFLDEVEALSGRGQVALLRFLQDQTYRPLGAGRTVSANVRVIAASNDNLQQMQSRGQFRRDLYFRLNIMAMEMPPLRQRAGDVEQLAGHFVRQFNFQYDSPARRLSRETLRLLADYHWPGNVRELENLIHREFLLAQDAVIRISPEHLAAPPAQEPAASVLFEVASDEDFTRAKARIVAEFEKSFLARALAESGGNVSLAARRCGKERRTFGKLLKKYGIDRAPFQQG
ncbi:MAG TPA: sigma-54 dependent transcriptional regulator [Burkholderiales bacterium]